MAQGGAVKVPGWWRSMGSTGCPLADAHVAMETPGKSTIFAEKCGKAGVSMIFHCQVRGYQRVVIANWRFVNLIANELING